MSCCASADGPELGFGPSLLPPFGRTRICQLYSHSFVIAEAGRLKPY